MPGEFSMFSVFLFNSDSVRTTASGWYYERRLTLYNSTHTLLHVPISDHQPGDVITTNKHSSTFSLGRAMVGMAAPPRRFSTLPL